MKSCTAFWISWFLAAALVLSVSLILLVSAVPNETLPGLKIKSVEASLLDLIVTKNQRWYCRKRKTSLHRQLHVQDNKPPALSRLSALMKQRHGLSLSEHHRVVQFGAAVWTQKLPLPDCTSSCLLSLFTYMWLTSLLHLKTATTEVCMFPEAARRSLFLGFRVFFFLVGNGIIDTIMRAFVSKGHWMWRSGFWTAACSGLWRTLHSRSCMSR